MAMEDATLVKHIKHTFVLRSDANREEFSLHGEMLVGREVECAIPLNSGHVSRYHAKINVSANGVYIEDLHSTNGTFVNGNKIKGRVRLSLGDEVAFDDLLFRLASNRSGAEDSTQLAPRRHSFQANTSAPVASISRLKTPTLPDTPLDVKVDALRNSPLDELDSVDLPPRAAKPQSVARPTAPPERSILPKQVPVSTPSSLIDAAENNSDRTQLLSAAQLHDLVERHRDEKIVNLGSGPRFIVMTAPIRGKIFQLKGTSTAHNWQIGRDPNAEICLNDKTISNDHARLALTPNGGYLLTATHAKNGIYVNGDLTSKAQLHHEDKIQIGRSEMVFKTDEVTDASLAHTPPEEPIDTVKMRRLGMVATLVTVVVLATALILTTP